MSPGERRLRALIIAEAANPEWASVPLVGWLHSRALAARADVHVVTQVRNREAFLRAGLVEGRDFSALDSEAVARPLHRIAQVLRGGAGRGWTTAAAVTLPSYYYFEHLLWKRFGGRIRRGDFDLVHRLTPLSPTTPSPVASRCARAGVPFVLGPLNGGAPWPRDFDGARRRELEWLSYLRSAYALMPAYRSTLASARAILVGSKHTLAQVPSCFRKKCVYLPENGIDPLRFPEPPPRAGGGPLQVLYVGRLVPYKGPDMALEAAAGLIRDGKLALTIVGDGPERPALEARLRWLGLEGRVAMPGWVDPREVHRHFARADLFLFPSIREFGGGVALEAMAMGAVPIVVDYAGPAELVTPRTGFLIPLGPRDALIARLRAVLEALAADPSGLPALRAAGFRRARESFTWTAKASQVARVYDWVLGRAPSRPDFGVPLR
jgi:glycosyltransferase involved in cell wall biosynthesis